jgi:transcription elongation factor B subunit 1
MADDKKLSDYVTLVSNDGYEFKILRSAACIAGTIKKALDPTCSSYPSPLSRIKIADARYSWFPRNGAESRRAAYDQVRPRSVLLGSDEVICRRCF